MFSITLPPRFSHRRSQNLSPSGLRLPVIPQPTFDYSLLQFSFSFSPFLSIYKCFCLPCFSIFDFYVRFISTHVNPVFSDCKHCPMLDFHRYAHRLFLAIIFFQCHGGIDDSCYKFCQKCCGYTAPKWGYIHTNHFPFHLSNSALLSSIFRA